MSWDNVKLIFKRELRDQARDRRTLFSVIGLPVLLYPLMGLLVLQVMQFRQTHPTRLKVVGLAELPDSPELIRAMPVNRNFPEAGLTYHFSPWLFEKTGVEQQFEIEVTEAPVEPNVAQQMAKKTLDAESIDAILYFPPGFKERTERFRRDQVNPPPEMGQAEAEAAFPSPQIFVNSANEKSTLARNRLAQLLHAWREQLIQQNLEANEIPIAMTNPFVVRPVDISEEPERRSVLWAKVLPFIVVIWALTGAFYPAIDLCAGEKERGTLETLLSSPALRSEIVSGKLLAIMTFSIATSLLNLASMAITAGFVLGQMSSEVGGNLSIGPPPLLSLGWLLVALVPMSALFSALALAIAAMARSSKEGQYYLLPLLMVNLPLVVLPVLPDSELTFGTSLIPVTGMLLLLKTLMEGDFQTAATYLLPVLGVTAFCIWVSVRWAIDQFNNESVLFRESERFNLRLWLIKVWRDRQATPSVSGALVMGIVLLALPHMVGGWMTLPTTATGLVLYMVMLQVGLILLPVLVAAKLFTRSLRKTFLLRWPSWKTASGAALLALCVHPFAILLREQIQERLPISPEMQQRLAELLAPAAELPLWAVLGLIAVLPAVCEEFACRGFILSGLRHLGHKWAAITISAVVFGMMHGILQQSIAATLFGMLIGLIAVQSRSLVPCIIYHVLHNGLTIGHGLITQQVVAENTWLRALVASATSEPGEAQYHVSLVVLCGLLALWCVRMFQSLPAELSAEERRLAALGHQQVAPRPAARSGE